MPEPTTVHVKVAPTVEVGFGTKAGLALTIVGAGGSIAAALKSNDTATVTAGVGSILVAVTTLGGRFAQAVALVQVAARAVRPVVDAVADEPAAK